MDCKHRLASFILDSTIGTETVATSRAGARAQPARINDPRRNDGDELAFVMHLFNLWGGKNTRFNYSAQNCPINFAHEREIRMDIFKHEKYGKFGSARIANIRGQLMLRSLTRHLQLLIICRSLLKSGVNTGQARKAYFLIINIDCYLITSVSAYQFLINDVRANH